MTKTYGGGSINGPALTIG